MDNVYVFEAHEFDDAFQRALQIGRAAEEEFVNADKHRVRWRLKEVVSLDLIRSSSLDGAEVYSDPVELQPGTTYEFDTVFHPEQSSPTQTI
jgi:hypothetical protein